MPTILASLAASYVLTRKLPKMAVITAVVVTIFGGLTLILRDDTFVKMKPTILYGLFAGILGFGLLRGQSYLKYLMDELIPMRDEGWMKFTARFVVFYLALAVAERGGLARLGHRHLGELPHLRAAGRELPLHHGAGAALPALRRPATRARRRDGVCRYVAESRRCRIV